LLVDYGNIYSVVAKYIAKSWIGDVAADYVLPTISQDSHVVLLSDVASATSELSFVTLDAVACGWKPKDRSGPTE
jgi:hypothetical protein